MWCTDAGGLPFFISRNPVNILVAMSDRVARLAEIRRKRKAQEQEQNNGEILEVHDAENGTPKTTREEAVFGHLTKSDGDKKEGDTNGKDQDEINDEEVSEVKIQISGNEPQQLNETAVVVEHPPEKTEVSVENLTYNSDLKRDLAPYLKRAQIDTERALNTILQEKYQEAARANAEDV